MNITGIKYYDDVSCVVRLVKKIFKCEIKVSDSFYSCEWLIVVMWVTHYTYVSVFRGQGFDKSKFFTSFLIYHISTAASAFYSIPNVLCNSGDLVEAWWEGKIMGYEKWGCNCCIY